MAAKVFGNYYATTSAISRSCKLEDDHADNLPTISFLHRALRWTPLTEYASPILQLTRRMHRLLRDQTQIVSFLEIVLVQHKTLWMPLSRYPGLVSLPTSQAHLFTSRPFFKATVLMWTASWPFASSLITRECIKPQVPASSAKSSSPIPRSPSCHCPAQHPTR